VLLVIDTNIFISALFARTSLPAHLITLWRAGGFDLLTSVEQLDELIRVTRYPRIRKRLSPALTGRMINELRDVAIVLLHLPAIAVSQDPHDNYLLATASSGSADFLITGDKRDLLSIGVYDGTTIVTVRDFLTLQRLLP
jgi:putative PIN family toxin of toxin-antitoxin system